MPRDLLAGIEAPATPRDLLADTAVAEEPRDLLADFMPEPAIPSPIMAQAPSAFAPQEQDFGLGYDEFAAPEPTLPAAPTATWGETMGALPGQVKQDFIASVGGAIQAAGEMTYNPIDLAIEQVTGAKTPLPKETGLGEFYAETGAEIAAGAEEEQQRITPKDQTFAQQTVGGAARSLAAMIPGVIASVIAKSPVPLVGAMGAQEGGRSYAEARAAGKSPAESRAFAGAQMTAEMLPEAYTAKVLFKAGTPAFKRAVETLWREVPGENLTTVVQSINAWLAGLDDNLTMQGLFDRLKLTTSVAALAGGGQSLVASGIHAAGEKLAGAPEEAAASAPRDLLAEPTPKAPLDVEQAQKIAEAAQEIRGIADRLEGKEPAPAQATKPLPEVEAPEVAPTVPEAAAVVDPAREKLKSDIKVFWHGSPSGDLRGSAKGLHIGTHEAARQALNARIGIPAQGDWDGTREYGRTLLAGQDTLKKIDPRGYNITGFNVDAPKEDYYPTGKAKYGGGEVVGLTSMPNITPVRIKGKMTNTRTTPHEDFKANAYMQAQIKRGRAKSGYYYENVGEDAGSISAVVPSADHIELIEAAPVTEAPKAKEPWEMTAGEYVKREDVTATIRGAYFDESGKKIASSRTVPSAPVDYPIGTWKIDDIEGAHGKEIDQLRLLDPNDLIPSEESIGREADIERYAAWSKEGKAAPPIMVVETDSGKLKVSEGHRRWLAAKKAGTKIRAWVSPTIDLPGKFASDGTPIKVGLTDRLAIQQAIAEGKPVPAEVLAEYPDLAPKVEKEPTEPAKAKPKKRYKDFDPEDLPVWSIIREGGGISSKDPNINDLLGQIQKTRPQALSILRKGGKSMDEIREWTESYIGKPLPTMQDFYDFVEDSVARHGTSEKSYQEYLKGKENEQTRYQIDEAISSYLRMSRKDPRSFTKEDIDKAVADTGVPRKEFEDVLEEYRGRGPTKQAWDLEVGDKFEQHGEEYTVKDVDHEGFLPQVTLEDGVDIIVEGDERVEYDEGTFEKGKKRPKIKVAEPGYVDPYAKDPGQTGMFAGGREMPKSAKATKELKPGDAPLFEQAERREVEKRQTKIEDVGKRRFTTEQYYENKKKLKDLLKRIGANPFADPEVPVLLAKMGAYHIRRGAKSLAEFTTAMKEALGEKYKQFKDKIAEIYESAKEMEFEEWFGESEVVEEYEPLVVYHGTTQSFDIFDIEKLGKRSEDESPTAMLGFFFSTSPKVAGMWAVEENAWGTREAEMLIGGNIRPSYLRIENPLEITNVEFVEKYLEPSGADWRKSTKQLRRQVRQLKREAERDGHDGIHIVADAYTRWRELEHDNWIAFKPKQIRPIFVAEGESRLFTTKQYLEDKKKIKSLPEEVPTEPEAKGKRIVSTEAYYAAKKEAKGHLNTMGSMKFLHPKVLKSSAIMGAYHIESGARSLAAFSAAMKKALGKLFTHIEPHISEIYESAKKLHQEADKSGMGIVKKVQQEKKEREAKGKRKIESVRIKHKGDIEVAAHEIAHLPRIGEPTPKAQRATASRMVGAKHVGKRTDEPSVTEGGPPRAPDIKGKPTKEPIRREDVLRPLLTAMGVRMYQGRIKGRKTVGLYKRKIESVRIKHKGDIEVAAHEIAHLLDDRHKEISRSWRKGPGAKAFREELKAISYDVKQVKEGFAEFVRLWMTQKEQAAELAPKFHEWFEGWVKQSEHEKVLRDTRKRMHEWFEQGALERAASKIGATESVNAGMDNTWSEFRQSVADDLEGIFQMEKSLTGKIGKVGAYESARLTRRAHATVEAALDFGAPYVIKTGDFGAPYVIKTGKHKGDFGTKGKGLRQILAPVANNIESWTRYAVGRSADELMSQGRENLFTKVEIAGMKALETPAFKQAFDEYQIWNRAIVDFAQDHGIINPESRKLWRRAQYLPFHRVGQQQVKRVKGMEGNVQGIKALTGGTGNIKDVLDNMIQNASRLIVEGIQNQARVEIADLADKTRGGGQFMEKISKDNKAVRIDKDQVMRKMFEAGIAEQDVILDYSKLDDFVQFWVHGQAPKGGNVIAVMREGKPHYYEVIDPLVYRAIAAFNRPSKGWVTRFLGAFRQVFQKTITLTADFATANINRDTLMASIMSKHGFRPFMDTAKGMLSRIRQDDNYKEWMVNGGSLASHMRTPEDFKKRLKKFHAKRNIAQRYIVDTPGKLLHLMEIISESFESASRLGEFQRAKQAGERLRHSAYSSGEATTDFTMRGDSEKLAFFYDTVPFLNAGVVGIDRTYRGLVRDENRAHIAAKVATLAGLSMTLFAINRGIEEYDELEDWDKDTYWHLFIPRGMGKDGKPIYFHWRQPKIWEIGAIASVAERAMGRVLDEWEGKGGDTKELAGHMMRIMADQFKLDYMPAAVAPWYEQALNRHRFTDRPIVPMGLQDLPPFAQWKPGTSRVLVEAGVAMRNLKLPPGLREMKSPARMEALLRGYLNTWAWYGLTLTDAMLYDDKPDMRVDEYPVLKRFYRGSPAKHTKYTGMFYDMLREVTELRRGMRQMDKVNRPEIANEMMAKPADMDYGYLMNTNKTLRLIHNEMQMVRIDQNLSSNQKRKELDALYAEKNKMLKEVVQEIQVERKSRP